jgi:hypothetical protein
MPDDLPELFAIVPVEGKSPPGAICVGPMSEVTAYIGQSIARIAEEERLAQAQRDAAETERHQAATRTHALQMFSDGIARLGERIDQFAARKQAHEAQLQREKEEAETARVEALLAALPDPDAPDLYPGTGHNPAPHPAPHELSDDGDFEAVNPPPETEKHNPEHRTESLIGIKQSPELEADPPEPGDYSSTAPAPSPYRNPASIGLN